MKAQISVKTRNRGHDWTIFHRLDKKKTVGNLVGLVARDALMKDMIVEAASMPDRFIRRWGYIRR
jgi:hypothetical protein